MRGYIYGIAMAAVVCAEAVAASPEQPEIIHEWQRQYDDLQQQIHFSSALGKSAASTNQEVANANALILPSDRDPADVVLRRTEALLQSFKRMPHIPAGIDKFERQLNLLKQQNMPSGQGMAKSAAISREQLYLQVRGLQRTLALSNPLLDFDTILFVGYVPSCGAQCHMIDQYLGLNALNGGGLYKVCGFKPGGASTAHVINVLANATVTNGRFQGQSLTPGDFMAPDLSYDGKTIVFAWTNQTDKCYHIFKVNSDGTNLVQLTDGHASYNQGNRAANASQNDFDPCWLPNGRIVFISERRGGYGRCHLWEKPTWTLFSMKNDGTDIIPISYHETNEWHPSVNNDGMIVYTRWDYLDRGDMIAHHLWTCWPDGRDPRAPHGNYPLPLTTIPGTPYTSTSDGLGNRPNGEWNIRSIPNSQKYVATAAGHHSQSYGELILIDPTIPDDGKMSQVKCITNPWVPPFYDQGGAYGTAWPLSEEYFLCNKNNSIILRDIFGNEDIICNSTVRPLDPIPLRPRQKPPALPTLTWEGERVSLPDHKRATISIMNVTYGDFPLPAGTKVTAIRIMQIIPKSTPVIDEPRIGYPAEALARMSLGTAPVQSDGSAYFEAPVDKEIYFQLIDDKGLAVQSMRAGTYVHKGEQLTCFGCHEDKWKATPPLSSTPLALRRQPSKLAPEAGAETGGVTPINYYRLVKPVFDRACVPCHQQKNQGPTSMSYTSVKQYAWYFCGEGNPFLKEDIITSIRGGSRTIPGMFGARYSRMGQALLNATHQAAGISNDDIKRVVVWLDGNSNEFSGYRSISQQQAGQLVWPEIDCDPANPTGVEPEPPPTSAERWRAVPWLATITHGAAIRMKGSILTISNIASLSATITLCDMSGRQLIRQPVRGDDATIDLSRLAKGMYVVSARGAGYTETTIVHFAR